MGLKNSLPPFPPLIDDGNSKPSDWLVNGAVSEFTPWRYPVLQSAPLSRRVVGRSASWNISSDLDAPASNSRWLLRSPPSLGTHTLPRHLPKCWMYQTELWVWEKLSLHETLSYRWNLIYNFMKPYFKDLWNFIITILGASLSEIHAHWWYQELKR